MAGHETMIEILYLHLLPHHFAITKVILASFGIQLTPEAFVK